MDIDKDLLKNRIEELRQTLTPPNRDDGGKGWDKFLEIYAVAEQAGAKFPIVLASQWAIESGWGEAPSGKNNYFGVKARPGEDYSDVTTSENYDGEGNKQTSEKFINYDSPIDSILDRMNREHWRAAEQNSRTPSDYINYLTHISKYATDSNYDLKLANMVASRQSQKANFGVSFTKDEDMPKDDKGATEARKEREASFKDYLTKRNLIGLEADNGIRPPTSRESDYRGNYSPEMMRELQKSGTTSAPMNLEGNNPSLESGYAGEDDYPTQEVEEYDLNSRGNLDTFYGIASTGVIPPQETDALMDNAGRPDMNEAKYGGRQLTNKYQLGGGLLNEFNEGGKHEENSIGGIPQGIGPNGKLNTVEEGETKYENYVFSDTLKLNSNDISSLSLPKKLEGKTYAEASKYLNKFVEDDPANIITKKTVQKQLDSLILGNEKAKSVFEGSVQLEGDLIDQNQMFLGGGELNLNNTGSAIGGLSSGVNQFNAALNADDPDEVDPLGNTLSMAGSGAAIGSIVPGVGTAIGAGVGAVTGLVTGLIGKNKAKKRERKRLHNQSLRDANMAVSDFRLGGRLNQYRNGGGIESELDYMERLEGGFGEGYNLNDPVLRNMWGLNNINYNGPENSSPASRYTPTGIAPWEREYPNSSTTNEFVGPENENTNFSLTSGTQGPHSKGSYDDLGNPIDTPGYRFSKGPNPLQYANVLGSVLNYRDANKLKPEAARLNRLNTRINPNLIDERALLNNAQNAMNTSISAITNASGGSGAAARAGILGSGINYNRGLSEATLTASQLNNQERSMADRLNLGVDQFNIGQDNLEGDINAQRKEAVRTAKMKARNALFDSISGIGKESTYDRRIRALTGGYDNATYNPEGFNDFQLLKKFFNLD